jgi:hypothetical protein
MRILVYLDQGPGIPLVVFRKPDGSWTRTREAGDFTAAMPIRGSRDITIGEKLRGHAKRVQRSGPWIEVPGEIAAGLDLQDWCRRHTSGERPDGAFLFSLAVWDSESTASISSPFIPEFHDPDPVVREHIESEHSWICFQLRTIESRRRQAIDSAVEAGHSRRKIAPVLGLSYARVQQLVGAQAPGEEHSFDDGV